MNPAIALDGQGPTSSVPVSVSVNDSAENSCLLRLHDSLMQDILGRIDIKSRVAASISCRRLARVSAEHPPTTVDLSSDGVHPETCRAYIARAKGSVVSLITARHHQHTACAATSARRFSTGLRCTQVVPYTSGPAALRLAACLPALTTLALHEATSCLGGMTDEFATAVAAHCPRLSCLEVAFTRYSLPSECFTDSGMMALAAGCPRLSSLSLTNCGAITNRSLYAVAVHCRGLTHLALGGYHELISDYGTVVLFQACTSLVGVVLSGKLLRVTDESAEALAAGSGAVLRAVKLTRSMGDRSLAALSRHCSTLHLVDCGKCDPAAVTAEGVAALITALTGTAGGAVGATHTGIGPTSRTSSTSGNHSRTDRVGDTAGMEERRGTLRVVLPLGVAATDVLRLQPGMEPSNSGGEGEGVGRWRAVIREPATAVSAPLAVAVGAAAAAAGGAQMAVSAASASAAAVMMSGGGVGSVTLSSGPYRVPSVSVPEGRRPPEEVVVRLWTRV